MTGGHHGIGFCSGTVPRADVAEVIAAVIDGGLAIRAQFEVIAGPDPIPVALQRL